MKIKFLSLLLYWIVRLLHVSYRYRFLNREVFEGSKQSHPQKIHAVAFWHQNIISTFLAHLDVSYVLMASASKDGELIASAAKRVGHDLVRGSSKRGGAQALELMIKKMKSEGLSGALTVDGPRGPAKKCKRGVIELATQIPCLIQPILSVSDAYWTFNSWDKFRLPKPFSKIYTLYGNPISVPENISMDDVVIYQEQVEKELLRMEEQIQKELGL